MTPMSQRIGIAVIAVVMVVGTLGSFALLVIANDNALKENERLAREEQALVEQQQKEQQELSDTYLPIFKEYEDRPASFDADKVGDEVEFVDLKKGDGETITEDVSFRMYYLGWNPKGVIFDSSFGTDGESLNPPLTHLSNWEWEFPGGQTGSVIEGWVEGVEGMKIGGVREITIPSDLAYGETGQGDDIPPNTPIKFIVMAIPASE